jgi:hypothetical protein
MKTGRLSEKAAMTLTIAAAICIVAAAVIAVVCYRSGGFFAKKPPETAAARALDFKSPVVDYTWPEELTELNLPSYQKDFALYSAFSYAGEEHSLTLVYATRAKIGDIRAHYLELLDAAAENGRNDEGSVNIEGLVRGRKAAVTNYFSEVSTIIRVDVEMTGDAAALIRKKIAAAFPEEALTALPEIAAFAAGSSDSGYVMYDYNTFAEDVYANLPLFSRAYPFNGSPDELKARINALAERFSDPASARISDGEAAIQHGPWLYQIKPLVDGNGTRTALVIQAIPDSKL